MPVLGSNIMVDLHVTADTDVDSVRGAVASQSRIRSDLAGGLEQTITETASEILDARTVEEAALTVDVDLVDGRVPGAPRERIDARLDVEGDESVLAAVDEAVNTPERARIADAIEARVDDHLKEVGLAEEVDTTVIVTPIQFR